MPGPAIDLALSPFSASAADMISAARRAEADGLVDGVWSYDHLVGTMLGRGRSHDPFVVLGGVATATERVRVGPLVANMMNRHPVALVLATASLQSISGGRVVLGLGAGASPGSRFAGEHDAIGTKLLDGPGRRRRLAETIEAVRAMWHPDPERRGAFHGEWFTIDRLPDLVGDEPRPRIVVGASGPSTVAVALNHADGVNLLYRPNTAELLELVRAESPADFEVSLHLDLPIASSGDRRGFIELAPRVDRVTIGIGAPYDLSPLEALRADMGVN